MNFLNMLKNARIVRDWMGGREANQIGESDWTNGQRVKCGDKRKGHFTSGLEEPGPSRTRKGEKNVEVLELEGTDALGSFNVFLNHRGPDVKKTFVAHLEEALCVAGCRPFLDAKSLIKGQHAFNSINKALHGVLVHVAIFSPRYAESKYCLTELCDMLESSKTIIPVYYGVEPEDLRMIEKGPFALGFQRHLDKGRHKDVKKWKTALLKAVNITGFRLAEVNKDEAKLKKRVVTAILKALPMSPLPLPTRHPVGLEQSARDVMDILNRMGDNVGVLGIFGMGGIGKTTLATQVYNQHQEKFRYRSFLKDVRSSDVLELQSKMTLDLLQENMKKSGEFSSCFQQFKGKKLFVVIDDVDDRRQFHELIPCMKELAKGSRVVITSRDQNLLNNIMQEVGQSKLYEVQVLSSSDALQLFIHHAFYNDTPNDGFLNFSTEIANACGGLPLALEVIGAFLFDKRKLGDEKIWRQAVLALRKNGDILSRLKISYDGLSEIEDKWMFLDIACFFVGIHVDVAMEFWESDEFYGPAYVSLRRLMDKSLVEVDWSGRLSMHDLLRNMGHDVVKKQSLLNEGKQSHLWNPSHAVKVLENDKGTSNVRALSVAGVQVGAACEAERYAKMTGLRLLILDDCPVNGDFSKWPRELRWLQWRSLLRRELPPNLKLPHLTVLDLANSTCLSRIWSKDFEVQFPCSKLRVLNLKGCIKLEELPEQMNQLSGLRSLTLHGCSSLKSLPDSVGELKELEILDLGECSNLEKLPETIIHLLKLKNITLASCTNLKEIPVMFGRLTSLVNFDAHRASSLSSLPASFSLLSNLRRLSLWHCKEFHELPASIGGLKKLKVLDMSSTQIEKLPEDFGLLQNLTVVKFTDCKELQAVPNVTENCQQLELGGCDVLTVVRLQNMRFLRGLNLNMCGNLQEVHVIESLTSLKLLILSLCPRLEELKGLSSLTSLGYLGLSGCQSLRELDVTGLISLDTLDMSCCGSLKEVQGFDTLVSLQNLDLSECIVLRDVKGLDTLTLLESLNLRNCHNLYLDINSITMTGPKNFQYIY